jgi:hypothetical protein
MGINVYDPPFFKPPTTSVPFPQPASISSGQIVLFQDADWGSASLTINTTSSAYPEGYPFSFSGTGLQDKATWIAFNLPTGTVCTLFDNMIDFPSASTPFNLAGAGVCVDLIGNGEVQYVDLYAYGANDRMSAGIWRQVDLDQGWFQLFRDSNCEASFVTIFLSEWPTASAVSLDGWDIIAEGSSINYPCLTPPQVIVLSSNTDGTGSAIALGATNPFGSSQNSAPATVNLTDRGINDKIHSFTYSLIEPVKAVIDSVTISPVLEMNNARTVSETITGTNNSSDPVVIATNVFENQTYTITNTTTLLYQTAIQLTESLSVSYGVKDIDSTTAQITVQTTTTTSTTYTTTVTQTQSFQAGLTITFTAPPSQVYSATAIIAFGNIPSQSVTTTGHFYYRQNLPGSVPDPLGSGLFVLDMSIVVTVSGTIGSEVSFDVDGEQIATTTAALVRPKVRAHASRASANAKGKRTKR